MNAQWYYVFLNAVWLRADKTGNIIIISLGFIVSEPQLSFSGEASYSPFIQR